jgi:FtsP/CotA-like multicopper oxidase with cupredoxin domain
VPKDDKPLTFFAESIDRSGFARGTLTTKQGQRAELPQMRERAVLTMKDMGAAHGDMDHGSSPETSTTHEDHDAAQAAPADHAAMGHGEQETDSHAGMTHDAPAQTAEATPAEGWASGAPSSSRVLQYAELKAAKPHESVPPVVREITMRLGGQMERYVWTIDGHQHHDAEPLKVTHGERLRITFVNETMMAHPMHLHGMFFELDQGMGDRNPLKHTVLVPPGQSASILLTADAFGKWALHCHLLFHMLSGMMSEMIVLDEDGEAPPWY